MDSQRTESGTAVTPVKLPVSSTGPTSACENQPTKRPATSPSFTDVMATAPESLLSVNRLARFASRKASVDPGERAVTVSETGNRSGASVTVRTRTPTPVSPEKPSSVSRPRDAHYTPLSGAFRLPVPRAVSRLVHCARIVPSPSGRHAATSARTASHPPTWASLTEPPSG